MYVVNESKMQPGWFVNKIDPYRLSATFLVKGTFDLHPGKEASLAKKQDGLSGDIPEESSQAVRYPSDFAWNKPNADVLLAGTCHMPGGKPNAVCPVRFTIGSWSKELAVIGDRIEKRKLLLFSKTTEPEPFQKMRLSYDRSYGGPGYAKNPFGRGHATEIAPDGTVFRRLPNLEDPDLLRVDPASRPIPAGFGPIPITWPQRTHGQGTYRKTWLKTRWPGFPADYDWRMQNTAAFDQQFRSYLRGDEDLVFENLHSVEAVYRSKLPETRARVFLQEQLPEGFRFREVKLNLDTLFVDMDEEKLILVWRGVVDIRHKRMNEVKDIFILAEPLDTPARTLEDYADELQKAKAKRKAELKPEKGDAPAQPELPNVTALKLPSKKEFEGELAKLKKLFAEKTGEAQKMETEARQRLLSAGVAPALLESPPDLDVDKVLGFMNSAVGRAPVPPAQPLPTKEDFTTAIPDRFKKILENAKSKHMPKAKPRPPLSEPPAKWTRDLVAEHAAGGGGFANQDLSGLDLSELALSGVVFKGAVLTGANLRKAKLEKTDFSLANVTKANLEESDLTEAVLERADLTESRLGKARLFRTNLVAAELTKADLTEANLEEISAKRAILTEAKLPKASLVKASMVGANFEGADVTEANFRQADLSKAAFGKVKGQKADLEGATVKGLRAIGGADFSGANFQGVKGERSVWSEAILDRANFQRAVLPRALFAEASLRKATMNLADFRYARFSDANLEGAHLLKVNLFQADMSGAILRETDLRGSNLYQVEFHDADYEGAGFQHADLTGTKLA